MALTYLDVPFKAKDEAKSLGARWDAVARKWYVPEGRELAAFQAWLPVAAATFPLALEPNEQALITAKPSVSLSHLLSGVAQAVAQAFSAGVWTRVEVVEARSRNGHVYLELAERDADGSVLAKANAAIWAGVAQKILPEFERATGASIAPGIKLLVRAKPVFKPQFGFTIEIDALDPEYTLGDLEARKREIRTRLKQEGIFATNKSLPAPWDFNTVLVIAPLEAAGLGDFQAEAKRLNECGLCEFVYAHSRFQGEGAANQIREALLAAITAWAQNNKSSLDAVVIIRGGGAVNDLAWLNDYALAKALCELGVPVLTGIGHERDNTILDEVAHTRFDTPSKVVAGIERVIFKRAEEAQDYFSDIAEWSRRSLETARATVERRKVGIDAAAHQHLSEAKRTASALIQDIDWQARAVVKQARLQSTALMREIAGQGPEKTLARGFAIVRDAQGKTVTAAKALQIQGVGSLLSIQFRDASVNVSVGAQISEGSP